MERERRHWKEKGRSIDHFMLSKEDVQKMILKRKKSIGHDNISDCLVKGNVKFFSEICTPLFNKSLDQGIFPDALEHSIIIPVFKMEIHRVHVLQIRVHVVFCRVEILLL